MQILFEQDSDFEVELGRVGPKEGLRRHSLRVDRLPVVLKYLGVVEVVVGLRDGVEDLLRADLRLCNLLEGLIFKLLVLLEASVLDLANFLDFPLDTV